jgi:uncharacterized protein YbaR (Trm112 family)
MTANESRNRNLGHMETQRPETQPETTLDPRLLEVLVCPVTRGALVYDREAQELVSRSAGLAYPIRNGVPIMLADEARRLED